MCHVSGNKAVSKQSSQIMMHCTTPLPELFPMMMCSWMQSARLRGIHRLALVSQTEILGDLPPCRYAEHLQTVVAVQHLGRDANTTVRTSAGGLPAHACLDHNTEFFGGSDRNRTCGGFHQTLTCFRNRPLDQPDRFQRTMPCRTTPHRAIPHPDWTCLTMPIGGVAGIEPALTITPMYFVALPDPTTPGPTKPNPASSSLRHAAPRAENPPYYQGMSSTIRRMTVIHMAYRA